MKGRDKMVVILLRGCGVRFRQHSLYEHSAANVDDFYRFQPRTKIGRAAKSSRDGKALVCIVYVVSIDETDALF